MTEALQFLNENRGGIFVLFLIVFGVIILIHYALWVFARGRFSGEAGVSVEKKWNYVVAEAAIKLVNDFRHLLALLLILVFSFTLGYAVYLGRHSMGDLKDALQAVMATLGGLIGSIIGYYFGESSLRAGSNTANLNSLGAPDGKPSVLPPPQDSEDGQGQPTITPVGSNRE